jgi:hypothetical protein
MIAYVKDDELHTLGFSNGETKQLTFGARESRKVSPLQICIFLIEQYYLSVSQHFAKRKSLSC